MQVLLLPDVVENFRKNMCKKFGIDPLNFVTTPSYSWEFSLKNYKNRTWITNRCQHGTLLWKWY